MGSTMNTRDIVAIIDRLFVFAVAGAFSLGGAVCIAYATALTLATIDFVRDWKKERTEVPNG